mgnify:CR=1 FL=1
MAVNEIRKDGGNGTDKRTERRDTHHPGTGPGYPFVAGSAFVSELKSDGALPDGT